MESVLDVISLVVSISAVLVSIYAVVEARRERKQNLKLEILRDHLKRLEESRNILMDMPETGDKGVIQFNQICALKKIIDNNYLDLGECEYDNLKIRFNTIYDNYEKVSGKRLNIFNTDLECTCALYGEMDYPKQLSDFYNYIFNMIDADIRDSRKRLLDISKA